MSHQYLACLTLDLFFYSYLELKLWPKIKCVRLGPDIQEFVNLTLFVSSIIYILWAVDWGCTSNQMDPYWSMALTLPLSLPDARPFQLTCCMEATLQWEREVGLFGIRICMTADHSCSIFSAGWDYYVPAPNLDL